jgi:hypothetical protein
MLTVGVRFPLRVLLEEISSRSEFADREAVAGHTACLEHHGITAGGVAAVLTGGFELVCGARLK